MSNWLKYSFCIVLIFLIWSSCKDPEQVIYKIYGTVTDSTTGNSVSEVSVDLSAKILENGTFNNSFQHLASTTTNSSGYFEFNVEREAFNQLKLELEKDQYLFRSMEFSPDDIDPDNGISLSNSMDPLAFAELHLTNISPLDEGDQISFRYTTAYFPQCECCDSSERSYTGTSVDTTIVCPLVGNTQLDYLYTVSKGGGNQTFTGTFYVNSFTTEVLEINY